ncbi:MAG: DUF2344 domain-containing protein [Actinobacteria bacterium]|nr:DUF2344 domain-containing protein [Actinomycetota bacterium]
MGDQENKIRFKFEKKLEFKYLSHLDIIRLFERAIRRAGIKVKYSGGYNPKPKISFSPPVPLGIESQAEYGDIYVTSHVNAPGFREKVNRELKPQLNIVEALEIPGDIKNLMADIAIIQYNFKIHYDGDRNKASLQGFRHALAGFIDDSSFAPSVFMYKLDGNSGTSGTGIHDYLAGQVLNLYGYATIFKEKGNKIFKLNDFLIFFRGWLEDHRAKIFRAMKTECFVIRAQELKTPLEVAGEVPGEVPGC